MSHRSHILLTQFLEMMAQERKVTRSTLSSYETDLLHFSNFFRNKSVEQLTRLDIQDYLLTQKHLAHSTIIRRLSSLRQFYVFLTKEGRITENPLLGEQMRPQKARGSALLSKENIEHLLKGIKTNSVKEKRLALLLHILSVSDIAVDVLVSLPLTFGLDALKDPPPPFAIHDNLIITLTKAVHDAFREYMKVRRTFLMHNQESPWLFPSSSHMGHLTRQRFGQLVKELSVNPN